jgi:hypothetical protein
MAMGSEVHRFLGRAFVGTLLAMTATAANGGEAELVKKITKSEHTILKLIPPTLTVTAVGQVPTGGWTNAELVRMTYVTPPADGIQDYELKAKKPDGIVTQALSTVTAKNEWKNYSKEAPWMKGFRIKGEGDGIRTVMFSAKRAGGRGDEDEFSGTSKDGNFQKALDAAVAEASAKLSQGGADIQIQWMLKSTTGVHGGITGQNTVTVTITAKRK